MGNTILSLLLISICIASSLAKSSVSDALSTKSDNESSLLQSITNLFGESRLIRRLQYGNYNYYYTYGNGGDGEDGEDGEDGDDDEGDSGSASGESGESGASGESGSESGGDDDGEDGDVAYYSNNGGGYNYYQFYGEVDDEFVDED